METDNHNLLLHRAFQYLVIISVLALLGGGYWYWKQAKAAVKTSDNRPSFEAPLTHDLNLTAGQGSATYSRADGADRRATVTDFEGLIRPVKNGEARFEGARRVENLLAYSENFENAAWTSGSVSADATTAPDGTNTADQITITAVQSNRRQAITRTVNPGDKYVFSVWLKASTTSNVAIEIDRDGGTTFEGGMAVLALTDTWKRYSYTYTFSAAHTGLRAMLVRRTDDPTVIYAWGAQLEEVTGKANQNPSEYVSTNIKTASPYHGAGVDGVKYFDTENGNTVASNVVTEATGTAIATATLKGYLSEGARTNLLLRSEEADAVNWSKSDSTITANASVSPGGKTDADLVTEGTAGGASVGQAKTVSASTSYVFSTYLKRGNHDWVRVVMYQASDTNNQFRVWANLATGALGTGSATGTGTYASSSIRSVGNGWYRVSVVGTLPGTDAIVATISAAADSSGTRVASGTRYVWGAQLEQASFSSSYIPTTSVTVTRAMDSLAYPLSENSNDTEGSFLATVTPNWTNETEADTFFISNSSHSRRLSIWHWAGLAKLLVTDRSANSTVTRNTSGDVSQDLSEGVVMNLAMKYDDSYVKLFRDGSLRGTDSTLTLPYDSLINNLYIGRGTSSATHSFSNMKNVRAWKKALTDTELNNLTSLTQSTSESAVKETTVKTPDNTGLVAYWSFEDGSGTKAEDFSPSGANTGTLTNGPVWTDGKIGRAVAFDGTDDRIDIPVSTDLPGDFFRGNDWTISAWVKPTLNSTLQDIFMGVWHKPRIYVNQTGSLIFSGFVSSVYTGFINHAGFFSTDTWTHMTIVSDGVNYVLYKDGTRVNSVPYAQMDASATTFRIGADGSGGGNFNGMIDEVRVYDRALPQAEITNLYRTTSSAKLNASQNSQLTDGLVGLWSFNGADISGTTAYDRSGQGNDGTLTNGPTAAIGKVGQALTFDGVNEHVNIASMSGLPSGAITVSAWIRPAGLKNWGHVAYHEWVGSNGSWLLFTDALGKAIFGVYDNGAQYTSILSGLTIGNWHHVVGTYDGSNVAVYLDGVPGPVKPLNGVTLDNAGQVTISNAGVSSSFNGSIDEVRIYDHALTQAEISALYSAGR